jgi:hypothetical protein
MNWLYPRTALDMIFPGPFWYLCVWTVMVFVFVGAASWDLGVLLARGIRWVLDRL